MSSLQMMGFRCIFIAFATLSLLTLSGALSASETALVDMIVQSGGAKTGDSLRTICEVLAEGRHILAGTPSCSILCPPRGDELSSSPPIQCCLSGLCYVLGPPGNSEGSCELCSAQAPANRREEAWCDTPEVEHCNSILLTCSANAGQLTKHSLDSMDSV